MTLSRSAVAAQTYTVRDAIKTPEEIAQSLARIRSLGYEAVQLSALGPIETGELKAILEETGLNPCATHNNWTDFQENLRGVVEYHQALGCKHTCVAMMPQSYWSEDGYRQFAREMNEIGAQLVREGLTFSYHNHSFELQRFGYRTGLAILVEETDPEVVGFEIDTYWIQHGGGDPAAWLRKVSGRMPLVHLKDMTIRQREPIMAEVGEGNLNWPAILEACRDSGAEWYIVEQDHSERDPFESLQISLSNLKEMGIE